MDEWTRDDNALVDLFTFAGDRAASDNPGVVVPQMPEHVKALPSALDDELLDMVRWAYSKLHHVNYTKQEDALMLDRMKLLLEHGAQRLR